MESKIVQMNWVNITLTCQEFTQTVTGLYELDHLITNLNIYYAICLAFLVHDTWSFCWQWNNYNSNPTLENLWPVNYCVYVKLPWQLYDPHSTSDNQWYNYANAVPHIKDPVNWLPVHLTKSSVLHSGPDRPVERERNNLASKVISENSCRGNC